MVNYEVNGRITCICILKFGFKRGALMELSLRRDQSLLLVPYYQYVYWNFGFCYNMISKFCFTCVFYFDTKE